LNIFYNNAGRFVKPDHFTLIVSSCKQTRLNPSNEAVAGPAAIQSSDVTACGR